MLASSHGEALYWPASSGRLLIFATREEKGNHLRATVRNERQADDLDDGLAHLNRQEDLPPPPKPGLATLAAFVGASIIVIVVTGLLQRWQAFSMPEDYDVPVRRWSWFRGTVIVAAAHVAAFASALAAIGAATLWNSRKRKYSEESHVGLVQTPSSTAPGMVDGEGEAGAKVVTVKAEIPDLPGIIGRTREEAAPERAACICSGPPTLKRECRRAVDSGKNDGLLKARFLSFVS